MLALKAFLTAYRGYVIAGIFLFYVASCGYAFHKGRNYESASNSAGYVSGQLDKWKAINEARNNRPDNAGLFDKLRNGTF